MICLLISAGAVLISVAYLAWEFHVAPVIPDPADVQAIQDAPAIGRATVPPARRTSRTYLTDRAANQRAAELDKQLPADRWEQLAPLYLTPGEPGEHRTTWTREDYRS